MALLAALALVGCYLLTGWIGFKVAAVFFFVLFVIALVFDMLDG
jgi:hypothetical protein